MGFHGEEAGGTRELRKLEEYIYIYTAEDLERSRDRA